MRLRLRSQCWSVRSDTAPASRASMAQIIPSCSWLAFGIGLKKPPQKEKLRRLQVTGIVILLIGTIATALLVADALNFAGVSNPLAGFYRSFWLYVAIFLILPWMVITSIIGQIRLRKAKKRGVKPTVGDHLTTPQTAGFRAPPTDQERKIGNIISTISYVLLFLFAAFPVIQSVGIFEAVLAVLLVILLWMILHRDARKMNNVAALVAAMIFASIAVDYVLIAIESVKGLAAT